MHHYKYRLTEVSSKVTGWFIHGLSARFADPFNPCQAPTMFQERGRIKTEALQKFSVERERQTYQKAILLWRDDSLNCSMRTEVWWQYSWRLRQFGNGSRRDGVQNNKLNSSCPLIGEMHCHFAPFESPGRSTKLCGTEECVGLVRTIHT